MTISILAFVHQDVLLPFFSFFLPFYIKVLIDIQLVLIFCRNTIFEENGWNSRKLTPTEINPVVYLIHLRYVYITQYDINSITPLTKQFLENILESEEKVGTQVHMNHLFGELLQKRNFFFINFMVIDSSMKLVLRSMCN